MYCPSSLHRSTCLKRELTFITPASLSSLHLLHLLLTKSSTEPGGTPLKTLKRSKMHVLLVTSSGHHSHCPQASQFLAWQLRLNDYLMLQEFYQGLRRPNQAALGDRAWAWHGRGKPLSPARPWGWPLSRESKQRLRAAVEPRSQGSAALATPWSGSTGLLEMSQLWLCSVP